LVLAVRKSELDTPFIAADIDIVKGNIARMQELADRHAKKLRPHSKTHKLPSVALWQVEAGAAGICVQKTSEAEVMVKGGVRDVFVSNEVIGRQKTDRLAALATKAKVSVAVDSELGVKQVSQSANLVGVEIGVYLDVDVGLHRCGVNAREAASLAELVSKSPNVYLVGVMGYDGHSWRPLDDGERRKIVDESRRILLSAVREVKAKGVGVDVISVGGTPSTPMWAEFDEITELEPGAYVYNDVMQLERGAPRSNCAVTLTGTVMSKQSSDQAVVDAGSKSFALDFGRYPIPVRDINGEVVGLAEEHAVLRSKSGPIKAELADRLDFIPYHICPFIDLWDTIQFCHRDEVVSTLRIEARGART
jgi:D-serine deaminase-like pyridoxal phosphate-dependent protein